MLREAFWGARKAHREIVEFFNNALHSPAHDLCALKAFALVLYTPPAEQVRLEVRSGATDDFPLGIAIELFFVQNSPKLFVGERNEVLFRLVEMVERHHQ
jgi:hypothetical protein